MILVLGAQKVGGKILENVLILYKKFLQAR